MPRNSFGKSIVADQENQRFYDLLPDLHEKGNHTLSEASCLISTILSIATISGILWLNWRLVEQKKP